MYAYDPGFIDWDLGGFIGDDEQDGKQKVPTLRNVDKRPHRDAVKAFMHNGMFKSLEEVVHFYSTRGVLPARAVTPNPQSGVNCWTAPEVDRNVNVDEMGNLGLTEHEERALVAFMKTLTDGWPRAY